MNEVALITGNINLKPDGFYKAINLRHSLKRSRAVPVGVILGFRLLVIVIYKLLLNHLNGLRGDEFNKNSEKTKIAAFYLNILDFQHPLYIRWVVQHHRLYRLRE